MSVKKVNSKWKKGGQRYTDEEVLAIRRKYREAWDFHQGARIRRVTEGQRRAA